MKKEKKKRTDERENSLNEFNTGQKDYRRRRGRLGELWYFVQAERKKWKWGKAYSWAPCSANASDKLIDRCGRWCDKTWPGILSLRIHAASAQGPYVWASHLATRPPYLWSFQLDLPTRFAPPPFFSPPDLHPVKRFLKRWHLIVCYRLLIITGPRFGKSEKSVLLPPL